MTPEIAIWILSATVVPLLGLAWWLTTTLKSILSIVKETLAMHREPDKFGFGTGDTNTAIKDGFAGQREEMKANTKALRAHTHYMIWFMKQQTGKEPPPPIDDHS